MVHDPSTQASKPTIVVIPGGACPSVPFYQPLCDELTKITCCPSQTADLQTASRAPPQAPATLEDDAQVFHQIITTLVERGEDVVVVAHSYGGMAATDAVKGLAKADREASRLAGGVVRMIYLTCILADVGETAAEVVARSGLVFKMEPANEKGGFLAQIPGPTSAANVFSDLPLAEALKWQSRQSLQSAVCFEGKCTYDAYRHIPTTFIKCTEDLVLTVEFQDGRIEFLKQACAEGGGKLDVVEMQTGHCPNVSALEETAGVIARAIEKGY